MLRTPRATNGQPTSREDRGHQHEDRRRGEHQRHRRAKHEHDVDDWQDDDEIGRPHDDLVDPAAAVARDAADRAVPSSTAPATAASARLIETRAPCSTRESRSRPKLSAPRRNDGVGRVRLEPGQRTCARADPPRSAGQAIGEHDRMDKRRVKRAVDASPAAASVARKERSMLQLRGKRRQPRAGQRERREHADERQRRCASRPRPEPRARIGDRQQHVRDKRADRQEERAGRRRIRQPDSRSRARKPSIINRPSPGHEVTISTMNDPLKRRANHESVERRAPARSDEGQACRSSARSHADSPRALRRRGTNGVARCLAPSPGTAAARAWPASGRASASAGSGT